MANVKCDCAGKRPEACAACRPDDVDCYWCDSCERPVAEKRCPLCGLKTRRKKSAPA